MTVLFLGWPGYHGSWESAADLQSSYTSQEPHDRLEPGLTPGENRCPRIRLSRVALEGDDEPDGDSGEDLTERLDHLVSTIDVEETVPKKDELIDPKLERLLTENRAAGWFTMGEGSIHTDNLVAICEGRLIQIQGSIDLAGRLQVEKGKLFAGGRMVPFRLDCMLGTEPCGASPDFEEMDKSGSAELSNSIRLLSEGAKGVYGDLHF